MPDPKKLKVLFLCTGNSCRSQMAEGLANHLKRDIVEAYSAGTDPVPLNSLAVKAMNQIGIDISKQKSKHLNELKGIRFDHVITVCGHASENCPVFPSKTEIIHVRFEDPPKLAENAENEEEALVHYIRVRDEIKAFIETIPQSLMSDV